MDEEISASLANELRARGITFFRHQESLVDAFDRDIQIQEAIEKAKIIVVLWTPNSIASREVRAEATYALNESTIFPIRIDDVKLWARYDIVQSVPLSSKSLAEQIPAIVDLISLQLEPAGSKSAQISPRGKRSNRSKRISTLGIDPEEIGKKIELFQEDYVRPSGSRRSIVFIAHATVDKPLLRPIVEALLDNEFNIWIDKPQNIGLSARHLKMLARSRIRFEGDWKEQVNRAARSASKILVCWSKDAMKPGREQFHYEVYMGLISEKLAQCRLNDVTDTEIGFPYTFGQIADLKNFSQSTFNLEFQYLMDDLASKKKKRFFTN